MDEFDKEFENAPDAEFDQAFEQAPVVEDISFLDKPSPGGPTLRESGQTIMDFATGAAKGATLGAADELGGIISTGLEKAASIIPGTEAYKAAQIDEQLKAQGFQIPEESLMETYRGYQQASEQAQKQAAERSPIASTIGELGGNIATGIAAGGALGIGKAAADAQKARPLLDIASKEGKLRAGLELLKRGGTTAAQAAPVMALESVAGSENQLVGPDAQPMEVGKDVLDNLLFGGTAILGMQGVTDVAAPAVKKGIANVTEKIDDAAQDNPFYRKVKRAFELGEEGVNPTAERQKQQLLMKQTEQTKGLLNDIMSADKKLGREVGASLEKATQAGQVINIDAPIGNAIKALDYSYQNLQDMQNVSRGREIFNKIADKLGGDVSPSEAKALLDDMDAFIGKFQASNNRTTAENNILETLVQSRRALSNTMKDQIEGYRTAAQRFENFRTLVPETILSADRPVDVTNVFMGNLRNVDQKLFDKLNLLATESTAEGSSAEKIIKAMGNLKKGMQQFEVEDAARGMQSPLKETSEQFSKKIQSYADEAQMLRDMQTVKSPSVSGSNLIGAAAQLGKGGVLAGANVAGRVSKPVANLSKKVYNMPAEKLSQYAQVMENTPGLQMYGKALRQGLENGDTAKKNAALFSIMQNPSARIIFNENEEE